MEGTDGEGGEDPLIQPRVVRFLKGRRRLVDYGVREEILDSVEDSMSERRKPDTVAEEVTLSVLRRFEDAGEQVATSRARKRLRNANTSVLSKL